MLVIPLKQINYELLGNTIASWVPGNAVPLHWRISSSNIHDLERFLVQNIALIKRKCTAVGSNILFRLICPGDRQRNSLLLHPTYDPSAT